MDWFGCSVAISGDTVVIGACDNDNNGTDSGSAYVFVKPAGGWGSVPSTPLYEDARLLPSNGAAYDHFGNSVAIDGDAIVIGAHQDDDNGADSGSAYVFVKPIGGWASALSPLEEDVKLLPSDGAQNDRFGNSVGITGDTAVIGAPFNDGNATDSGSAYLFAKPGGGWGSVPAPQHERRKLLASNGGAGDELGCSVAISSETPLVGARYDDDKGTDSGSAYVFGTLSDCTNPDTIDDIWATISPDGVDVILGWSHADTTDTDHYHIWRAVGDIGGGYALSHDTSADPDPLATTWIDVGIGGDTLSYFYIVDTVDSTGAVRKAEHLIAAKLSYPLELGWNLVSPPLIQQDEGIVEVLKTVDCDCAQYWDATDPEDHWKTYCDFKPPALNDLWFLNHRMGFWLNVTGPDIDWAVAGTVPMVTEINAEVDWNMTGYPYFDSLPWNPPMRLLEFKNMVEAQNPTVNVLGVEVGDQSYPYNLRPLEDTDSMGHGRGYWVKLDGPATITFTNYIQIVREDCNDNGIPDELDPDADGDGVPDDCDNCLLVGNALQDDTDTDGVGDLCDPCPADAQNDCNPDGSTAGEISADEGGTLQTPDGDVTIEFDPGDLFGDTTISITETVPTDPEVDLLLGPSPGLGRAIAVYTFEPDGLEFSSPVTITVVKDVTELNENQRNRFHLYLYVDNAFENLEADCGVIEDPPGTFIATCTAELDHFSVYGAIVPLDTDDDGVADLFPPEVDNCDLYNPDQADCQPNGVGDVCDIAYGTSSDVNGNGIPDLCEAHDVEIVDDCSYPLYADYDYGLTTLDVDFSNPEPSLGEIVTITANIHNYGVCHADSAWGWASSTGRSCWGEWDFDYPVSGLVDISYRCVDFDAAVDWRVELDGVHVADVHVPKSPDGCWKLVTIHDVPIQAGQSTLFLGTYNLTYYPDYRVDWLKVGDVHIEAETYDRAGGTADRLDREGLMIHPRCTDCPESARLTVQLWDGDPSSGGSLVCEGCVGDTNTIIDGPRVCPWDTQEVHYIENGGQASLQCDWVATGGAHDIYVVVDPHEVLDEVDEANNIAWKAIGVTGVSAPGLPHDPTHRVRKHRYLSIDPSTIAVEDTAIKVEVAEMRRCAVDPRRACLMDEDCDPVCANDLDQYCISSEQCGGADCIETGPCWDMAPDYDPPLSWFVQEPFQPTKGCKKPGCNPMSENCCGDEDWVSRLSDTVYSEDWSAHTLLHIGDCGIVPCVTYHVYACDPLDVDVCSEPLEIATQRFPTRTPFKLYGDVVGGVGENFDPLPPNGAVNVVDLQLMVLTIQNYGTVDKPQTHPTWVDMHGLGRCSDTTSLSCASDAGCPPGETCLTDGNPPNYILNVSDLQAVYVHSLTNGLPWVNTQGGLDPGDCP
jgi:hypothetical protein